MSADHTFTVWLPPGTSDAEREHLARALRAAVDVVVIEAAGRVAEGTTAISVLAPQIAVWRADAVARGRTPSGRLPRPGQPVLDLATATEEPVLRWLLKNPLPREPAPPTCWR
jgi:hypothetical protein